MNWWLWGRQQPVWQASESPLRGRDYSGKKNNKKKEGAVIVSGLERRVKGTGLSVWQFCVDLRTRTLVWVTCWSCLVTARWWDSYNVSRQTFVMCNQLLSKVGYKVWTVSWGFVWQNVTISWANKLMINRMINALQHTLIKAGSLSWATEISENGACIQTHLQWDCASWRWETGGDCRHYPQTQTLQQAERS